MSREQGDTELLVGLSLSRCICDIIEGKAKLEDVACILSRTMSADDEWEQLFASYARDYWTDDPERAVEIARRLHCEGRIIQLQLFHLPCN